MQTSKTQFLVMDEQDYQSLIDRITEAVTQAVLAQGKGHLSTRRYVKTAEMARLLSVSENHLDRMREKEIIPSVLIGRSRRYCPEHVFNALSRDEAAK
ncbi:helix-turn-helix domain-containing protein [Rhodopirellula sp. JC740]|uniref:Helix-turn-helix domain-containing protein n=1 Tax=Rhodopirellula halodulae TaxID=2894198 RepID=A0ABS8NHZ7_9BACT|nr:helix-turn-helix domain-containing protein [Rhodopirellula sp. JC740]MCC9643172.1 helix-turn-helix domain-containing protein [Rhodopirellula sp. JC740]